MDKFVQFNGAAAMHYNCNEPARSKTLIWLLDSILMSFFPFATDGISMKPTCSLGGTALSTIKQITLIVVVLLFCTIGSPGYSTDSSTVSISRGDYLVKTEIHMPHLETNLRSLFRSTNASQSFFHS